jgi:hypothetical protein
MALTILEGEVMRQRTWADVPVAASRRKVSVKDFKFDHPRELEEAWNNLDLFDDDTVTTLANIKSTLRTIEGNNKVWGRTRPGKSIGSICRMRSNASSLSSKIWNRFAERPFVKSGAKQWDATSPAVRVRP